MKKVLFLVLTIMLAVGLAACGDSKEEGKEVTASGQTDENKEDKQDPEEMTVEENDSKDAKVGDTVKSKAGEMKMVSRTDDVGTFKTGPIKMKIKKVNGVSGKLVDKTAEMLDQKEIEYIQVDMEVENTSEENVTFYASQAVMTTNTGEQLEPDMLMSDHIDGEYIGAVKKSGTSIYILKDTKAKDVKSVRLIYSAPTDSEYENIGEEVDIETDLNK